MSRDCDNNIFLRPPEGYSRDLDIVKNATELAATYLSLNTGKPIADCINFIEKTISTNGTFPLKTTDLRILKRLPNGDRAKATMPIDKLLNNVIKTKAVMGPNMVAYDSPQVNKSCTSTYITNKKAMRSVIKKMGLKAYQNNDLSTFAYCNNEEFGIKLLLNSISGARASPHNPLFCKTAHSSLTSTTRTIVSYSNSSTEWFLSGNRHYWHKNIVIENILAITRNTNYVKLRTIINRYNLTIPSADDIITLIKRCTKFYWINAGWDIEIQELVSLLSPEQRAAFVYTGDLYHLAKFNDRLIRELVTRLVTRPTTNNVSDADAVVQSATAGITTLVGVLCADLLSGNTIENVKKDSIENYNLYAETIQHVNTILRQYADLIIGLFITDNAPPTIFAFPNSIRRCVPGSDTDSTMFTVQDWVEWYFGKLIFGPEADKVSNVFSYLNTQVISHMLALASKQMGVDDSNLYNLKMKNEYGFPIFMRANRAKHYATLISSREGNVYKVPKNDIKGVALKDSKSPKLLMHGLEREINSTMMGIMAGNGIDIHPLMQRMANLEHVIHASLSSGSLEYLITQQIASKDTYKKPMASKYMHYDLWVNVFQHKFGVIAPPPYRTVKVSTTLNKPTAVKNWIDSIDPIMGNAFTAWIHLNKRKETDNFDDEGNMEYKITPAKFELFLLPFETFERGLPEEFVRILNKRKIISEMMAGFYIFLEMMGMYIKNSTNSIMLMDTIIYRPEFGLPGEEKR